MELAEEFWFPEETIQYIQSFLNSKEAAQTTLVSKSWYTAWLTRPNLCFDQQHFVSDADFWKFVYNTLRRYHKLNLTIHSLKLWILHVPEYSDLVNNLIITALIMGATDLDFKIDPPNFEFALPHQVFEFHDLSRLSVSGCKIDKIEVVRCSRLKSLVLEGVYIVENLLWDIISCCPSIENFSFFRAVPPLCFKYFMFGLQHVYDDVVGLPNAFHKLKRLSLYLVLFDYGYFDDFSSKFPCLEDLAFHDCFGYHSGGHNVMKISSPSLQRIICTHDERCKIRLEFDVPRIRKFTFSGPDVPLLSSFKSSTRNWESDISILCEYPPHTGWFLQLRELLKELSLSKVSLSLKFMSDKIYVCKGDFLDVTDKPEVENLTVMGPYALDSGVFNSLFQCCCPIYVSQYAFPKKCMDGELKRKKKKCTDEEEQYDFSKMIQQVSLNSCIAYQRMTEEGESDLEEVRIEFYDESVSAWRPRLLDTSTAIGAAADEHRIRLHLRWGR